MGFGTSTLPDAGVAVGVAEDRPEILPATKMLPMIGENQQLVTDEPVEFEK